MILHDNGLFLLKNDSFSYLFKVGKYGELQHLHFGTPVEITDADCFACIPGPGWGSNLVMDDADPHSCPDFIPLEWSGSGRGDYRESPLEIGRATDLRYVNHRILEGSQPMACGLPQAHGHCETLEITLEQSGLRLKLYYSLFETALVRRTVVGNTGDGEISLHKCMSFSMDLPGNYIMTTFHGGWSAEMRRMDNRVGGAKITNESRTGASSNQHNPGFFLREAGTYPIAAVVGMAVTESVEADPEAAAINYALKQTGDLDCGTYPQPGTVGALVNHQAATAPGIACTSYDFVQCGTRRCGE